MRNIMHFLVFYLRGCDKEEVLPNEIACKEIVHLEKRNMEHLFFVARNRAARIVAALQPGCEEMKRE